MAVVQLSANQLNFDIVDPEASGEEVVQEPSYSRFKVGVELGSATAQRYAKQRVKVLLIADDGSGEVLAGARGYIQNVSFPVYIKDGNEWTERSHKVKFTGELQLEQELRRAPSRRGARRKA